MAETSARGRGRAAAWAATLAAPVFLYFIVRTAGVGLVGAPASATLPPADVSTSLRPVALASADPRFRVSESMADIAVAGARTAPLSFYPFYVAAEYAAGEGDRARAIGLMEEARARRPTFLMTRLKLAAFYGQEQRYQDMLSELDFTLRLNEQARQLALPELARMIATAPARAALATLIATDPPWRDDLYRVIASQRPEPAAVRAYMERIAMLRPAGGVEAERNLYISALADAGRHREARAVWLQRYPEPERVRSALLFDGAFRGIASGPPYGWRPHDNEFGRAELRRDGDTPYLEITYFGGQAATLIEQNLALAPGRYRIGVHAASDSAMESGRLIWSLACAEGGERARIVIEQLQPTPRLHQTAVDIPAGNCSGQRLSLTAEPGDISSTIDVRFTDMRVVRQ